MQAMDIDHTPGKSIRTIYPNHYTIPKITRVCAYVRVSTAHEGQQNSFQSQVDYYQTLLAGQPNTIFVGVFSDKGISGAKETRPGFQAMLEKARKGEIDLIYTKSISRFARNTLTILQTVRELRAMKVGIIFEDQNINTLEAAGELTLTVLAGIAEEERNGVRSNIQWSLRSRYQRGEVIIDTGRLLGYGRDESKMLYIIPHEAEIIRSIYQLYLAGVSAYRIARILEDLQVQSDLNRPWNFQRIISIISNEKYMGACLMQKSFIDARGRQVPNRGELAQYWIENDHPAIIAQADWERAQVIRKSRERVVYPFTSLLYCSFCGQVMIRVSHSGGYISWICKTYLRQGKAACVGARISEPRLIEIAKFQPITKPMIVEEVMHEPVTKGRRKKDYRLTPVAEKSKRFARKEAAGGGVLPGLQRQR